MLINIYKKFALLAVLLGVAYSGQAFSAPDAPTLIPPAAGTEATDEEADDAAVAEAGKADKAEEEGKGRLGSFLMGKFAETQGDTQNGVRFVEEALKNDPNNKKTMASLYRMYVLSGRLEEALPLAEKLQGSKVVEEGREYLPEMLLVLGAVKKGDYTQAQRYLGSIPKTGLNSILVPLLDVWVKQAKGDIHNPVQVKDVITDERLVLPQVYLNLAFLNDAAGQIPQALSYYEQATKADGGQPFRAVEALANLYARTGEEEKRNLLVQGYLQNHGDSALVHDVLTATALAKPQPLVKDAREGMAEAFYTLANMFHGVRATSDEIAILHFALFLRPDYPAAQFLLANAQELAEDYQAAIDVYAKIDPASVYFARGKIRSLYDKSEMGPEQVEAALAGLTTLANEHPEDEDALMAKGDILRTHARYHDALAVYTAATARVAHPGQQHWILYFSRGACYERLGHWKEAEADMKKALALSPNEPDVLNYLGYSWLSKKIHVAEAKKMVEAAYEARPEDPHIMDSMGYALYVTGDFTSAQEYFQQALERTPNDATVNEHLGDTYWQLGHKTEARFQWNQALVNQSDAEEKRAIARKIEKGIALRSSAHAAADDKKDGIELPADE